MDKYEYGIKLEQIEKLTARKDFITAAEIADGIDWRREKSVDTLFMIADIYEATDRLEDCYEILNIVYDRSATGRRAVYRLTQIATKKHDFEEAIELYKEYVQIAPHDPNKYILKYRISRESGSSVEEQILILEEYKSHEYDEEWAYELACLYEEAGRIPQCIEECDQLILWFSEGEYVKKALELKMKYQDLTAAQQEKYDNCMKQQEEELTWKEEETASQETEESVALAIEKETEEPADDTPKISVINTNKFSTLNLQEELAKGVRGIFEQDKTAVEESHDLQEAEQAASEAEGAETVTESDFETTEAEEAEKDLVEIENTETATAFETTEAEETVQDFAGTENTEIETESDQETAEAEETDIEKQKTADHPEEVILKETENALDLDVSDEEFLNQRITGSMTIGEIVAAWEARKQMAKEQEADAAIENEKTAVPVETGEISSLLQDFIPSTPKEEKAEELFEEEENEEFTDLPEIDLTVLEEQDQEEFVKTIDQEEEPIEEDFSEKIIEHTECIEDDLPQDIEEAELSVEEELEEVQEITEEIPEKENAEESDEEGVSQNTAAMLDAIERALAQEIAQTESKGKYLTEEQEKIFTYFTMVDGMKKQLLKLLEEDKAYAGKTDSAEGNLIITGHPGNGKTTLAIDIVKAFQKQRHVSGGRIAKVTGDKMNRKETEEVIKKAGGGALVIERAGGMNTATVEKLLMALEGETGGLLVILEDSLEEIQHLAEENPGLEQKFNRSVNIPIFSNNELVSFGKSYAEENEYYFDELAVLALYDCIGVRQTSDHVVNIAEVKEILDDAMAHADKKSKGFFARLSKKRIDEYGNKLLLEEDFEF